MKWCENVTHTHAIFPSISRWIDFSSRLYGRWRTKQKKDTRKQNHSRTQWNLSMKMPQFRLYLVLFKIQFKWIDDFGIAQNNQLAKWNMNSAIKKHCAFSVEWLISISRWSNWVFFLSFNHFLLWLFVLSI